MLDMVSTVTVTVPPKTGADLFPAFFKSTQTREIEKMKKFKQSTSRPLTIIFDVQSSILYQDAVLIC